MRIVIEELGQTFIALFCSGHMIAVFLEILNGVTAF